MVTTLVNLDHLGCLVLVDYVDEFFFSFDLPLRNDLFNHLVVLLLVFVRCLQMFLQEGFIAETSVAMHTLGDFQVNLVVATER